MRTFRNVVARECRQPGCQRYGQKEGVHEGFCTACEQPLSPVLGWDLSQILLVIVAPLIVALLGYSIVLAIRHRPRPLSQEARQHLEDWIRHANRDRIVTPRETEELENLVATLRLSLSTARDYVATARLRQEEGARSLQRAHQLAAQKRYAEARQEYRRSVAQDPGNTEAWVNLGLTHAIAGQDQEALDCYLQALKLEPGHWLAHYNLGQLWGRRGRLDEAVRHLERAFQVFPDSDSPQRRSMVEDLESSDLPSSLKRNPRFLALVASQEGGAR